LIKEPFQKKETEARFSMRKSSLGLAVFAICVCLMGLMFMHAYDRHQADHLYVHRMSDVVKNLELTDLCLFTEARYSRHLSLADLHSAFQDHPVSLEHFPAGSIAGPPPGLRRLHGKLD
jgi:hypothetical protein